MSKIPQEQYEREVLVSVLKDASNIMLRKEVAPRGLELMPSGLNDWRGPLIWGYLPTMAAAVPLAACTFRDADEEEKHADFWLILPREPVRQALEAYLPYFLSAAIEAGGVHADARHAVTKQAMNEIAAQVASWQKWGF